jgi:hypothetical protein
MTHFLKVLSTGFIYWFWYKVFSIAWSKGWLCWGRVFAWVLIGWCVGRGTFNRATITIITSYYYYYYSITIFHFFISLKFSTKKKFLCNKRFNRAYITSICSFKYYYDIVWGNYCSRLWI